MLKSVPKISVVMSVYNGEKYLGEAIDSILNQTFTDFEFIIIDDGSTDKSANIVKSYNDQRIVLIKQKNKGLGAALNTGIKAASGKYIARMDQDDISEVERFQKQYEFMQRHYECVAAGTNALYMDEEGTVVSTTNLKFDRDVSANYLMEQNPFVHGSMIISRETLLNVGGYLEIMTSEDDLLWVNLIKSGKMYVIPDILYRWRVVSSSLSHMETKAVKRRLHQIKKLYAQHGHLSEDDIYFINNIKDKRSIAKKRSDYSFEIGKLLFGASKEKSRKWFIQAFPHDPLNISSIAYFILAFFPDHVLQRLKFYKNAFKNRYSSVLPQWRQRK